MPATGKRTFSLPAEQAGYIGAQVASGAYATASEVVRAGLRALQERDAAVERWLREEVVPAAAAMDADPGRGSLRRAARVARAAREGPGVRRSGKGWRMVRWNEVAGKDAAGEVAGAPPRFAELSMVSLRREVDVEGRSLPAGTRGTAVAAYGDGIGYEVEFFAPFHMVVTLEADDLAR